MPEHSFYRFADFIHAHNGFILRFLLVRSPFCFSFQLFFPVERDIADGEENPVTIERRLPHVVVITLHDLIGEFITGDRIETVEILFTNCMHVESDCFTGKRNQRLIKLFGKQFKGFCGLALKGFTL